MDCARHRKRRAFCKAAKVFRWIVGMVAAAWLATPAYARELSFAIGHPPQSYVVLGGKAFADALKSGDQRRGDGAGFLDVLVEHDGNLERLA